MATNTKERFRRELERDLPDYEVEGVLGMGATATVYRASHRTLGRYVAIKRFSPESFMSPAVQARFEREAALWAHLNHENILHLYDYRHVGEARYIVMEFCDGMDLTTLRSTVEELPPKIVASMVYQILCALEYLHRYGVVHRDLKPANLFLTTQGVIKVMDFGISLCSDLEPMTMPGQVIGTPQYMSPEQAAGREVTAQSDLFSLGLVAYEFLQGEKAIKGKDVQDLLEKIQKAKLPTLPRRHPRVIRDYVEKSLRRSLKNRWKTATGAREKIEIYLQRNKIRNTRHVIHEYLQEKGILGEVKKLFPKDVTEKTAKGVLAETFRKISPEETKTRFWPKAFLALFLILLLVAGLCWQYPEEVLQPMKEIFERDVLPVWKELSERYLG